MINITLSRSKMRNIDNVYLFFNWLETISYDTEKHYQGANIVDFIAFFPQGDAHVFVQRFDVVLSCTVTADSRGEIDTVTLHVS